MTIYNWVTLGIIILGWAISWGRTIQKQAQTDKDICEVKETVKALRIWGESEVLKQVSFRDTHYVSLDRFNECTSDIKRRLDEVNTIEINSRLARIEAMLDQIQISLTERK